METTLHHHASRPLKAKGVHLSAVDKAYLTFASEDGNEVHIALPGRMTACVAMIVEAFNAHIADSKPTTVGIAPDWRGDAPLPTGSALRTADAIHLAQGWAALTDDDAMMAVERRDLP